MTAPTGSLITIDLQKHCSVSPNACKDDRAANDKEAVGEATKMGYTEVVKLLLAETALIGVLKIYGVATQDAIRRASSEGHADVVKLLLADERVHPSSKENGAIRWASSEGHADVAKLLLDDGRISIKMILHSSHERSTGFPYKGHIVAHKIPNVRQHPQHGPPADPIIL